MLAVEPLNYNVDSHQIVDDEHGLGNLVAGVVHLPNSLLKVESVVDGVCMGGIKTTTKKYFETLHRFQFYREHNCSSMM